MGKTPITADEAADHAAIDALSRQFRPALMRYFERRGVPGMDAEDMTQEVFDRLMRRTGVATIENLGSYVFETAGSVAVDYHRHAKSRGGGRHVTYQEALHAPADASPETIYTAQEELREVLTVLKEMPSRTRTVFVLVRLENMRQVEVGRRMGLSISGVEKHLRIAMRRILERVRRPT